jgi:hypothetical protein
MLTNCAHATLVNSAIERQQQIALYYELLRVASELLTNARKYILKVADLTGIPTVDVSFAELAVRI